MSKMYQLNRMSNGAAAGGLIDMAAKGILSLFKKKGPKVIQTAGKLIQTPAGKTIATGVAGGAGWAIGEKMLGGGGRGASGGWAPRRAKGITARELRGYRKVANLLHREGMVSRRARRGK